MAESQIICFLKYIHKYCTSLNKNFQLCDISNILLSMLSVFNTILSALKKGFNTISDGIFCCWSQKSI